MSVQKSCPKKKKSRQLHPSKKKHLGIRNSQKRSYYDGKETDPDIDFSLSIG
jgi:hypothetical protein